MTAATDRQHPRLLWPRRLWPVAPALLIASGVAGIFVDSWDASTATLLATTVLPILLAIVATAVTIGGRRGIGAAAMLAALAVYWAWWFGWGLDANISPFSVELATTGLADGTSYVLWLLVDLWPILLGVAIVVALVARRRGRRIWTALGALTLALIVLSFPARATWDDTCNTTSGAAPLITRPITQPLMDRGIGVLPGGFQTLMLCGGTGDRQWKPFWLGGDDLPPGPAIYGAPLSGVHLPKRLYRTPARLPGRRLDHVVLAYWPERDELYAVVETSDELATARPGTWPPVDFRIAGVQFDDDEGLGDRGSRGWCYSAVWVRNRQLPPHARGDTLRVDLEYRGQRLGSGRATVQVLGSDEQIRRMGHGLGCRPMW